LDNCLVLGGELVNPEPLRRTPAGIPLLSFSLRHQSTQQEAGMGRSVECEVQAVALGAAAESLGSAAPGTRLKASGFLARRSMRSTQLVMHITTFELI